MHALAPKKLIGGLAPIWVWRCKLHFPRYRLEKFHENQFSRFRERLSGIFVANGKSRKKYLNICKTYTHAHPPHRRLRKLLYAVTPLVSVFTVCHSK